MPQRTPTTSQNDVDNEPPRLWEPTSDDTSVDRYMRWLGANRGLTFSSYTELHAWSTTEPGEFWDSFRDFAGIRFHGQPHATLVGQTMPDMRWFPGATLNYAEHALAAAQTHRAQTTALTAAREDGSERSITYAELAEQVAIVQRGLIAAGVGQGDTVAALSPNIPETVIAFLATAGLGAIWSCCSPDFGARAVVDRFAQIQPKVLFAVDGYSYGGKRFDVTDVVAETVRSITSLNESIHIPYDEQSVTPAGMVAWDSLFDGDGVDGEDKPEPIFVPVDFDHPLWVLYSSGTTGVPKGIVHGHGGIVLEHSKALRLQFDLDEGDRLFWFTTTGWMMWNLIVSGLLVGATVVLYDGSPGYPDMKTLWSLADRHRISVFGVSAAYLQSCVKRELRPRDDFDLSSLKTVASTGSPLSAECFHWVATAVDERLPVVSSSGGTDVCSAFLGGAPNVPVWVGELSCATLGAAVHAFDAHGKPVLGEVGELVITEPMPSMPVALWGDDSDKTRLRATYFDVYPGIWRHGDWVVISDRGTAVIHGRSDSTLNRGGIRIGTSDLYSVVESFDGVVDSLVVDTSALGVVGEMLCFLVLAPGFDLDAVEPRLRAAIGEQLSPRHVPDRFLLMRDLPHTLNGKKCEVPVKRILTGTPVDQAISLSALRNPASIDDFVALASTHTE